MIFLGQFLSESALKYFLPVLENVSSLGWKFVDVISEGDVILELSGPLI